MIDISVYYVNGDMNTWEENEDIIYKLNQLEKVGYNGKLLIEKLFTDDWGVPPSAVILKGIFNNYDYNKTIKYE